MIAELSRTIETIDEKNYNRISRTGTL